MASVFSVKAREHLRRWAARTLPRWGVVLACLAVIKERRDRMARALAQAGLELIYLGAESGDDRVLEHINKEVTAAEIVEAGRKLKRCGLKTSVTLISGLGGRKGIREHALRSAELISGMNPEYASFLTLRLYEGTQMNEEVRRGEMEA